MTILDIEKYNDYLQASYTNQNTIKQYRLCALGFITNVGNDINEESINKFFRYYKKDIMRRSFISSLFRCFKIKDLEVPVERSRTKEKKRSNVEYKFLDIETINLMIDKCNERNSVLVSLMFDTGLRLNEAINLKKTDIDLVNNTVSGVGKGDKDFNIPFSNKTKEKLAAFLTKDESLLGYPFHYLGVKHHDKKFWRELKLDCFNNLNLDNIHPHRIRHALGHFLRVNKKWDLEQVREYMRHDSINTTAIYATATKEEIRKKMREEVFENVTQK